MKNDSLKTCLKFSIAIFGLLTITQTASAMSEFTQTCNHMSIKTCMLPFPSNQYTVPDASSTTGLKVDLKGSLFSEAVEDAFPVTSTNIYSGKNGFSAAAPVLFELSSPYNESSLPINGGNAFIVFNRDRGEREDISVDKVNYSASLAHFGKSAATIVSAYPRSRFQFGDNYVAVITKSLKPKHPRIHGKQYKVAPAVQALIDGTASNEVREAYEDAFNYIIAQGVSADKILSLTTFTVTDEYSNNSRYFNLVDIVERDRHPVRRLKTTHRPVGPIAAIVKGQVRLTDFRDADTGRIKYTAGMQGRPYWTDFVLDIPRKAKRKKVPVAIYGHGLNIRKESARSLVSKTNARKGVATIYIDQPYHGSRAEIDGVNFKELTKPEDLLRVLSMITQSSLDLESLKLALQTSLADLDEVPKRTFWDYIAPSQRVNESDLDVDQILYEGTSLGGVSGSTFASTAQDLKGAFMHVTGVGMANILQHSATFKLRGLHNIVPKEATGGEAGLFFHALQTEADISDGINFAHYARQGGFGRLPRPAAIPYGIGDGVVFNRSTEAYAELADLPLIGRVYDDIPHLRESETFEDGGYGIIQTPAAIPLPGLNALTVHLSFIKPATSNQLGNWLDIVTE